MGTHPSEKKHHDASSGHFSTGQKNYKHGKFVVAFLGGAHAAIHPWRELLVAVGALATYLIPGCIGRGVRLGFENSSGGGAGGVWKSGDLEIWEFGDLETWKFGDLGI